MGLNIDRHIRKLKHAVEVNQTRPLSLYRVQSGYATVLPATDLSLFVETKAEPRSTLTLIL